MDKKSPSSSQRKGNLYRSLLMPGFTDAGFGNTYVPAANIPRRTTASIATENPSAMASTNAESKTSGHDRPIDASIDDTFSEAATELHDNRSKINSRASADHRDRYYRLTTNIVAKDTTLASTDSNAASKNNLSDDSIEVEATYGFFPSTKPPPSPSPRRMVKVGFGGGDRVDKTHDKITKTPKSDAKPSTAPPSPRPRPASPPSITRKQLVPAKRSTSTAAVVEDEITRTPNPNKRNADDGDSKDTDGKVEVVLQQEEFVQDEKDDPPQPQNYDSDEVKEANDTQEQDLLHTQPLLMKREMKREMSTFSLAPETGAVVDREEHQANIKRWKEREEIAKNQENQNDKVDTEQDGNIEEQTTAQENMMGTIGGPVDGEIMSPNASNDPIDPPDNDQNAGNEVDSSNRRLDKNALQEMDRIGALEDTGKYIPFGNIGGNQIKRMNRIFEEEENQTIDKNVATNVENDDELSTSSSIVSSTCSEFGTVIQMGDATLAARMAEVEEMELAALAEEPIKECDSEHSPKASNLSSTRLLQHDTSSQAPILESKPSGQEGNVQQARANEIQSDTKKANLSEFATTSPTKRTPTKSEMVSAAFRRMGNIQSVNSSRHRGSKINHSLSAPTTPMRPSPQSHANQSSDTLTTDREALSGQNAVRVNDVPAESSSPPASFLLRSPGSSARFSLAAYQQSVAKRSGQKQGEPKNQDTGNQNRNLLNPRFASIRRGMGKLDATPLSPRVALTQTIQYAQKCLSYDNTLNEYGLDNFACDDNLSNYYDADERRRALRTDLGIPALELGQTSARLAPRVLPLESSSSFDGNKRVGSHSLASHTHAQSLDFSAAKKSPFRQPTSSTIQRRPFIHHAFPVPGNETHLSSFQNPVSTQTNLRGRIHSDFSPTKLSKKTMALNSTKEVQQPQRMEIEREDALDILACLVEQGIAEWKNSTPVQLDDTISSTSEKGGLNGTSSDDNDDHEASRSTKPSDLMTTEKEEKSDETQVRRNEEVTSDANDKDFIMHGLLQNFKNWCEDRDGDATPTNGAKDDMENNLQIEMLDELIKSHAYAVEMKRASISASAWLKSIGRDQRKVSSDNLVDAKEKRDTECFSSEMICNDERQNSGKNVGIMDALTLRAKLHSAQLELVETKQANLTLNEELSKCRAEIGRLKSASKSEHADKSMIDNSERSNGTSFSGNRTKSATDNKEVRMVDVPGTGPSYERLFHGVPEKEAKERIESAGELDVIVLLSSLEKANETIRRLHHEFHSSQDDNEDRKIPVVDIPEIRVTNTEPKSTPSTPDSAHRTVNVRMLDGENFVTDWDDLRTLPPPPDHGLKSPIVAAVLEQWTQDRSLHESLLAWIERVMKGDDLEGLRPLTISSLDHQVRDGFSMHVLPHLLRRADIHVAVQTRAHRQTTYDMSVTVSQKKEYMGSSKSQPQASLLDSRDSLSEDEWGNNYEPNLSSAESVAHSAVTEHIGNFSSVSRTKPSVINDPWSHPPQTPTQTEYSNFPSRLRSRSGSADTYDETSQHFRNRPNGQQQSVGANGTIMGALGGALSGLLSRNKYAISPGRTHYHTLGSIDDSRDSSNVLPASLRAQMDLTSSPVPGSKGLHRIGNIETAVSASIDDQYQHRQEEMEPYHRVVSAPPGRIGVTFVEFRGHAMVSDVAADSPLAGWVFPSDILIAVDDIPVSGMRVRDIVNILSTRKDRHRAMRVISSHAMNEFTMMSRGGGPLNDAIVGGD